MIKINNGADVSNTYTESIITQKSSLATQPSGITATLQAGGSLVAGAYYYVVSAVGYNGESVVSSQVTATSAGGNKQIKLDWTAQDDVSKYIVYRGTTTGVYDRMFVATSNTLTDNGTLTEVGFLTTGVSATATAGGVLGDDTYYYKVAPVGINGELYPSVEVNATTSGANNSVKIAWNETKYASKYYIYKGLSTGVYNIKFETDGLNFIDNGKKEFTYGIPKAPTAITTVSLESISKANIKNVYGTFVDKNEFNPILAILHIETEDGCKYSFDLSQISNQPTWTNNMAGVDQAVKDVLLWIQ